MNAFTNIPQLPDKKSSPAIEWQTPIVNSVPDALEETAYKIERLLALMESYVGAIGDLGGLGELVTKEQTSCIYMLARLAQEDLGQIGDIFAAIGLAYNEERRRGLTGVAPLFDGAGDRRRWVNALARYNAAEANPTQGMTSDELDADGDATSAALRHLLAMRCPDLRALAEKLDVIERTDATMLTGTMDHLRQDVAHLAGMPDPASSAPKLVEA